MWVHATLSPAHNQSQEEHGGAWELVVSLARPLHAWGLTSGTIAATSGWIWPIYEMGASGSLQLVRNLCDVVTSYYT